MSDAAVFDLPPYDEIVAPNDSGVQTAQPVAKFRLVPFNDVRLVTTPAYLVKGLIPRNGLTVLYGPPKSGKSFVATDLALHVALGRLYRGRKVQQGAVVYVALEGAAGFAARLEAFRQRDLSDDADDVPFYLVTASVDLVADASSLVHSIRTEIRDAHAEAVIIDTVNRSLVGSESRDEDMARYLNAAKEIMEQLGCAVILVHHSGIDASRPRGHTSLTASADAQLVVKRDFAGRITMTVEYMKDGPEGDSIAFRLEPVEVGFEEDGEAITSCVVVADDGPALRAPPRQRKLSTRNRLALGALHDLLLFAEPVPGRPADAPAVSIDAWRDELFRRDVLDPTKTGHREQFRRIKETLTVEHLIGVRDGLVWSQSTLDTPRP